MGSKTAARQAATAAGVPVVPGTETPLGDDVPDAEVRARRRHRLPADAQGRGRRRRQGHARRWRSRTSCPARCARPRSEAGSAFGDAAVYLERRLLTSAPHRGAAARRSARHGRAVRRARVLDPAPAPEGDRGEPVAGDRPPRCGAGSPARPRRSPAGRLHATPARSSSCSTPDGIVLLPRDEHPAAGRAPGHRDGHRPRPRAVADPDRPRRAPHPRPGGAARAARPRHRVPRLRRGSRQRLPALARPHPTAARAARARRARRQRRLRRPRGADPLRPAGLEADHLGRRPRPCAGADEARAGRIRGGRHPHRPSPSSSGFSTTPTSSPGASTRRSSTASWPNATAPRSRRRPRTRRIWRPWPPPCISCSVLPPARRAGRPTPAAGDIRRGSRA